MTSSLSPTRIALAAECPHFFFLEEFGDKSQRLLPTAGQVLDRERGRAFEAEVVRGLADVKQPEWDGRDYQAGFQATVALMKMGPAWIHGGVLVGSGIAGIPDLLRRDEGQSSLGAFTYSPVEIKGHKSVQKKDILQVTAYARILEEVLGVPCAAGGVWLNTGEIASVEVAEGETSLAKVLRQIEAIRRDKGGTEPIWCGACGNCAWIKHCKQEWKQREHLSLLPNGGKKTVQALYAADIRTFPQLAEANPDEVARSSKLSASSVRSLWNHARARVKAAPIQIGEPRFPSEMPIVFYDIETFGGETFLHGLIRIEVAGRTEKFFYADSLADAGAAWREFLDYIARDEKSIIYCWADYERGCAETSWKKYGGDKAAYELLMSRLTDQCAWTKKHYAFPTRGYSIKEVAPALGFHWKAEDAGGLNCEAWYGEWLQTGEPELKRKILEYNKDDVLAMEVVFNKLKEMHEESDASD